MKNILVLILPLLLLGCTSSEPNELANLIHSQIEQGKQVIAFGESHWHKSPHTLLEKTLRTKRIQEDIDVIIVEFGNSFYQDLLDRYIKGEDVSIEAIRVVWRNIYMSPNTVWDSPIYERFFKTIRDINKSLLPKQKYRVLAGGKSIDWTTIHAKVDLEPYQKPSRSEHLYEIVKNEVFVKNKKALLIAGGYHTAKIAAVVRGGMRFDTAGSLLELNHPGATFVINIFPSKIESLVITETKNIKIGSIILTSETWLRDIEADKTSHFNYGDYNYKIKDIADAFIYWGPEENWVIENPLKEIYQDEVYWKELNRRSLIKRNKKMDESLRE